MSINDMGDTAMFLH